MDKQLLIHRMAAELAAARAEGPASFKVARLDQIYNLTPEEPVTGTRVEAL